MNDIERLKDIIQCYKNNPMTNYNKEIVALAEEKIQSLQEKAERDKGCGICQNTKCKMQMNTKIDTGEAISAWNNRAEQNEPLTLEQFEKVCEAVHNGWWEECKKQGRENHPDMIPYNDLPENVKDYDRVTVKRVLDALGIAYRHKKEC